MKKSEFGRYGEELAEKYLEKKGFKLLAKNFRRRHGEIDLIMQDGETWVFVEVKARTNKRFGEPIESVTPYKREHIRYCANMYLYMKQEEDRQVRFDVVEIMIYPGKEPVYRHVVNAF
ncbi:YraN family protein [Dialister micraerophilus]|uniref:UPF0102 protein HMPREF9083_0315 n=1 Tax=Dialister micraerophilus DSM 19965 TaxID=888062 RepID=F2BVU8_9FIRM|nr:YraN family protein [Dialister micraerophilus]EGF15624.1 endonuclease [Dialister micraerophilus DSM 19965]MDK8252911.1 YraN family protein [Dialister micraerophilus]